MIKLTSKQGTVFIGDGMLTVKIPGFGGVVWECPIEEIDHIELYDKTGIPLAYAYRARVIHRGGVYTLELIPERAIKKYIDGGSLEGIKLVSIGKVPVDVALGKWYTDTSKNVHVASYENEKEYMKEANKAIEFGWTITDTTIGGKRFSVGKALAGGMLTLGIGAILGASGKKGKIMVTYTR